MQEKVSIELASSRDFGEKLENIKISFEVF